MRKFGYLAMVSVLLMFVSMFVSPISAAPPPIARPGEMIVATIEGGMPETVDPAWCYDTASAELIFNVYDVLLVFDGEHMDAYLGRVATEWVIEDISGTKSPEGLDWYFRYTFKIRTGIKFHDGGTLTPEDVEYSIERAMVQDRDGGPTWMFYEPLLDTWGAYGLLSEDYGGEGEYDAVTVGKMIDHAVESNATHVWFNLAFPGAYAPFLQILSQSWSSIMSKNWVKNYVIGELGRPDWNGEWGDYTKWIDYHNPEISPLDDPTPIMMGSGPFKFETLDYTAKYWSIVRNENYWAGWPADFPSVAGAKPAGYINRATVTWAYTWETRSTMFLAGDVDFCAVPREYIGAVLNKDGIRCIYPLPSLAVTNFFFTFNIDPATPYGPILAAGTFDETGIPSDFFGNPTWGIHNRKAFAYAFDYETFIAEAVLGEGIAPATAIIPGLFGYDPTVKGYSFDLKKAEEEFKKVPGLWEKGFTMTILYNTGNIPRMRACEILERNIESLNPKFHITISSVDWRPYLRAMIARQLPCFQIGWLADYPDPHNFAVPFYASYGTFAAWQGYSNPTMDALIEKGIKEPDLDKRAAIYHDIAVLAVEDCPNVPVVQAIGRHFQRDWVVGWYYNPIYPGLYFYNLWKWYYVPHSLLDTSTQPTSNQLPTDVNYDGKTDIKDIYTLARSFGSSFGPPVHPRWVYRADINNDRKIDIRDIYAVAKNFGKSSAAWSPP
jgi:peptide/nickel transport system substrate-binding protein